MDPFGYKGTSVEQIWQLVHNVGSDCVFFFNASIICDYEIKYYVILKGGDDMTNNLILNRLFTQSYFQQLIYNNNNNIYYSILRKYNINGENNKEAIQKIYNVLRESYRNEYYYKNTILNKLLLGVHSINTTTALTELPVASSKADFVLINGKAVVYEIKTELDNLERLQGQIDNYYKAFDYVCVLTCEEYLDDILDKYKSTNVGVYLLSKKETIKRIKEPIKYDLDLDMSSVFKILNKPEYERIILSYYEELPQVSQVKYYGKCRELFLAMPQDTAYKMFLEQLKTRNSIINKKSFYELPYELKSLVYFSKFKRSDYDYLKIFLNSEIGGN